MKPTLSKKDTSKTPPATGAVLSADGSLVLVIKEPVPSLNALLGMHWRKRHQMKQRIQESLLSALRATEKPFWTKITWLKNTTSMPCATLASYLAIRQNKRQSKLDKSKLKRMARRILGS